MVAQYHAACDLERTVTGTWTRSGARLIPGSRLTVFMAWYVMACGSDAALPAQAIPDGLSQGAPAARSCHAMTSAPALGGVVMFGGSRFCGQQVLADSALWRWNGTQWETLPGRFGGRREDVILAFDPQRNAVLLFGGRSGETVFADTWEWINGAWSQRAAGDQPGPGAVEHAAGAFDEQRRRLVVFGGGSRVDRQPVAALWEWDGESWTRPAASGPAARVGHSMTYSSRHGGVLLYGGFNEGGSFRDLWRWDGTAWARLDSLGPTFTEGNALTTTEDGLMVVGTGLSAAAPWTLTLGAWRWADGQWAPLGGTGPVGAVGRAMAYDWARRQLVAFGGGYPDRAPSAETWRLGAAGWIPPNPQ